MSVFFTDTDCEMDYETAEKLGLNIIGMPYTIEGKESTYDYGKNTNFKEFYDKMRAGEVATTSALNTVDYINYFEPVFASGNDILYVHFSSEMSGTFNYMLVAIEKLKEKYPERKIICFDTKSISFASGVQVIEAAKLHNSGASDEEVIAFLNDFTNKIGVYFYVDSLKYLKRGGRLSTTSAVVGTMLNIKPILTVSRAGKIEKLTTVMGVQKALNFMTKKFETEVSEDGKYDAYVIDADNKEIGDKLLKKLEMLGKNVKINRSDVGPVIGAHCGPGTIGLIFIKK